MQPGTDANWNEGAKARLRMWATSHEAVRAALLTSNRAGSLDLCDALSDFDIILVVRDIRPFFAERAWIDDFGDVLVTYWDMVYPEAGTGLEVFGNVVQYETGLRIDFTLWPIEQIQRVVSVGILPADLDIGYEVLVDKDGLTGGLPGPSHSAFAPTKPGDAEFARFVEEFYSDVPFVAKCLMRDELLPTKWALDHDMKQVYLRRLLEWQIALETRWKYRPGSLGKGLKRRMSPERWRQLEAGYTGAGIEDNWRALDATMDLFREVGEEVAEGLGYTYPVELDRRIREFLRRYRKEGEAALVRTKQPRG